MRPIALENGGHNVHVKYHDINREIADKKSAYNECWLY